VSYDVDASARVNGADAIDDGDVNLRGSYIKR
jgi:hypothetical protein